MKFAVVLVVCFTYVTKGL